MSVTIDILVEAVNTIMLSYDKIQLERAPTVGGSWSLITTITLVEDDYDYEYEDTGGTVESWYRYRYYNSDDASSSNYSNPFQTAGDTRKAVRQFALKEYRAGAVILASATGQGVNAIASSDYKIASTYYTTERGKGNWLMPSSGQREGEITKIGSVVVSSNPAIFSVSPALTGALEEDDEVEWHWLASPEDWNQAINRGLSRIRFLERVPITGTGDQEIDLSYLGWLSQRKMVTGLWYYPSGSQQEYPWGISGKWWGIRQEGMGLTLTTRPAIDEGSIVYLEALRIPERIYTDASVIPSEVSIEYAAAMAYDEVLQIRMRPGMGGASTDISRWERELQRHRMGELRRLKRLNMATPRYQRTQSTTPHTFNRSR